VLTCQPAHGDSFSKSALFAGEITALDIQKPVMEAPQSFSTELVPATDRLDAWQYNAKQVCGDCRFYFPKRYPFHGSIVGRTVAGLRLTRFSSSPLAFSKFPVANGEDRACIAITQLQGIRRYEQGGSIAVLQPGDTTLIDSGEPWSSDCSVHCTRLYLRMPWWLVESRLRLRSVPRLPLIPGTSGLGTTLFRIATSLCEAADVLTAEEGAAGVEAYLAILAGCLGVTPRTEKVNHQEELRSRLERLIEIRLADHSLNPGEVASALGISTRHLHRLFLGSGSSCGGWIRERRLQQCHADLSDSRLQNRTITEIALFWGFSDSAHFSKCFKRRFGVSPQVFRMAALKEGCGALYRASSCRVLAAPFRRQ
jgi:AraC family transcriptional regulator, positive regulator of tynA and feaB